MSRTSCTVLFQTVGWYAKNQNGPRAERTNLRRIAAFLVSPAHDSDTSVCSVEFFCHSCARGWRAAEFRGRTWARTGILRAAATRENDRTRDRARPELSLCFAESQCEPLCLKLKRHVLAGRGVNSSGP